MDGVREWGNLRDLKEVPESVKQLFVTALEISPQRHLQIQAAFQRHVDHSVSKTINLPESADHAAVAQAYLEAWEMGLKGVTIYRYGSKSSQVLEIGSGESGQQYDHSSRCDPGECRL